MIVYENKLSNFINDVIANSISDKIHDEFRKHHITGGSDREIASWNNSLNFMKNVLDCNDIDKDVDVAIEYSIPQTAKRIDFMVLGNDGNRDNVVIVELKQWAEVTKIDDISRHTVLADLRGKHPVAHPSYQAYSYKALIRNYCDSYDLDDEQLVPCAYLHNLSEAYRPVLEDELYSEWINEAPVFLKNDVFRLRDFIKKYVNAKSKDGELLYKIDYGKIKPTKKLQDSLDSMLCGNDEFKLIDEQAVAYDFIMKSIRNSMLDLHKHVLVIKGGPGTGKSVVAVNVLVDCVRKLMLNASYITKNSTPRNCYNYLLSKGNARKQIDLRMLFRSPHSLASVPDNGIDVGIFDEAHRLQKKPYMYKGEDLLEDAIRACKVCIFFIDEDQRVTTKDFCRYDMIVEYAKRQNAILDLKEPYELVSQFRCSGSDGYIALLDDLLSNREKGFYDLSNYDFKVFDNPLDMKNELIKKDYSNNRSRMMAGYCYDWNFKYKRGEWDIIIGDFKAKWNLSTDDIFAVNPDSIHEIGCIHTVQGMEFDYAGAIIGKDLIYRDGKVITDRSAISNDDKSSGIRTCKNEAFADQLIRNTYKVLLTRGQKGCFVYCEDKALRDHLADILNGTRS